MANKFWVPVAISAIANNGSGASRCTVATTTNLTTACFLYGVTGTTGLNGAQTISIIDSTHFDVTAVSFVATGTGSVNGLYTTANTANWATSTGGTNGAAIPGTADIAIFDGSSGAGTVTVDSTINGTNTIIGLTTSAFTGTLDFSVNNPSFTIGASAWTDTQTSAHTINMGSGTWTFNLLIGTAINMSGTSGLTLNANTSTVSFAPTSAATGSRGITLAANISLNIVTISSTNQNGFQVSIAPNGATIATLNLINGAMISVPNGQTLNITNPFNVTGSATALAFIEGTSGGVAAIIKVNSASTSTLTGVAFAHVSFSGSALGINPTNSFDFGGNNFNGGSLTSPTFGSGGGGGSHFIGG